MRLLALLLCLASASFAEDLIFLRVNPGGTEVTNAQYARFLNADPEAVKFEEARGR